MTYRTVIRPSVQKKIATWGLSDYVLVDVYLRLRELLPADPLRNLMRVADPFDGMVYRFELIDPENRFREYVFFFLVVYGQDEETLCVVNAGYLRSEGI